MPSFTQAGSGAATMGQRGSFGNQNNGTADAAAQRQFMVPFQRAAKIHTESFPTQTGTVSASNQTVILKVPIYGYLKRIWLQCSVVTAGNAAATAFQADGPWTFFKSILFKDANGTPIHNLSGYYSYLAALLGGYTLFALDNAANTSYSVTTGAGATGGSFNFALPLNQCFGRDALGALPNMDASTQYQIELVIGTTAEIYSTAPTNPGTFTIQGFIEAYQNPPQSDQFGNVNRTVPPNVGTVQFWSYSNYTLNAGGEQTILLNRVGNYIRNHILVFRTAAGARSSTVVPASNITWEWDSFLLFSDNPLLRAALQYDTYGIGAPTGVVLYGRTADPDGVPVGEYGDSYLPTLGSTKLLLRMTPGAAGQIDVITNDIFPVGNLFNFEG
jgi:hypothetical protein